MYVNKMKGTEHASLYKYVGLYIVITVELSTSLFLKITDLLNNTEVMSYSDHLTPRVCSNITTKINYKQMKSINTVQYY